MQQLRISLLSLVASAMLMSFTPLPAHYAGNGSEINTLGAAKATWVKDSHDFGEIPQGKPVTVEFEFTNTGDGALIIDNVVTSCGCTASDYSKEPILPGKSSKIKVSYNAAGKGTFAKTITVNSNEQPAAKTLSIKGVVR